MMSKKSSNKPMILPAEPPEGGVIATEVGWVGGTTGGGVTGVGLGEGLETGEALDGGVSSDDDWLVGAVERGGLLGCGEESGKVEAGELEELGCEASGGKGEGEV